MESRYQRYYRENKVSVLKRTREYYLKNKVSVLKRIREYHLKHHQYKPSKPTRWGIKKANERRVYNQLYRQEIIKKLGGKCVRCGIDDIRVLQVDHINGGGNKEKRNFTNNQIRKMIMNDNGSKYQLLCANCNWIKRNEKKEYPWH